MATVFTPEQVSHLLLNALNPATVTEATNLIREGLKSPEFSLSLCENVCLNPDAGARQLGAVLLRKKILKHWSFLAENLKQKLMQSLLQRLVEEPIKIVCVNIAHVVSAIAKVALNEWKDTLLQFLHQCSIHENPAQREVAMIVFTSLIENLGSSLLPYFHQFLEIFKKGICDTNMEVCNRALRGIVALSSFADEVDQGPQSLLSLAEPLYNLAIREIAAENKTSVVYILEFYLELVEGNLPLSTGLLLCRFVMSILDKKILGLKVRSQAMFLLEKLLENKPKLFTKEKLISPLMTLAARLVCEEERSEDDLDEDEEVNFEDDDEPVTGRRLGAMLIDRLCINLPPKMVYKELRLILSTLGQQGSLGNKVGMVWLLGSAAEGCENFMRRDLDEFLPEIIASLQSANDDLRRASLFSVCQFAQHLQPEILLEHKKVVPLLCQQLQKLQEEGERARRMQIDSRAYTQEVMSLLASIFEFVSGMSPEECAIYLPQEGVSLIDILLVFLHQNCEHQIKLLTISTLSELISSAGSKVLNMVSRVLQLMLPAITSAAGVDGNENFDHQMIELRAKAVDCIGSIAVAVGKEMFEPYLQVVLESVFKGLMSIEDNLLRQNSYQLLSCLSTSMKNDFPANALITAIPFLLASATSDSLDHNEKEEEDDDDEDILRPFNNDDDDDEHRNQQYMKVKTGVIDEQLSSLWCLNVFCNNSPILMAPSIKAILAKLQFLSNHFHDDIRKRTAELYASSIHALVVASNTTTFKALNNNNQEVSLDSQALNAFHSDNLHPSIKEVLDAMMPILWQSINEEKEKSCVGELLCSLTNILNDIGHYIITDNIFSSCCNICIQIIMRRHPCQKDNEGEDIENDEDARLAEEELFDGVSELLCILSKLNKQEFNKFYLERLHDKLMLLVKHKSVLAYRCIGIGCLGEIYKSLSSDSINRHMTDVIPYCLEGLQQDEDRTYASNAAFSLGIMFERGNIQILSPFVKKCIEILFKILTSNSSDDVEEELELTHELISIRDNVVGCLCRILQALSEKDNLANVMMMYGISLENLIKRILSCLPLNHESLESITVLKFLEKMYMLYPQALNTYLSTLVHVVITEISNPLEFENDQERQVHFPFVKQIVILAINNRLEDQNSLLQKFTHNQKATQIITSITQQ